MERRQIEAILKRNLEICFATKTEGNYYELKDLSQEIKDLLRKKDALLKKPVHLPVESYRDWPDGRGIFASRDMSLFAWVNEEDHLRIVSMQTGSDIKEVYQRLLHAQ